MDRPQPWPLARIPCLALGSDLARVVLLHPKKIMGSTHPSRHNRLTHEERFRELNLSGLASHSCEGRGDERTVCTAWRVQTAGREQGHIARLGVMPGKGKTEEASWRGGAPITGKPANLISSFTPRGPNPRNGTPVLGVPPSPPSLGLLSGTNPLPWHWAAPHHAGSALQDGACCEYST